MPPRTDIRSILIIGSGPINIGQACEFDYSGSQACRALARAGYRVVLVNSNPATIMTDPDWADATYIEPLDVESVANVIALEQPDALLPTLGGQTALNLALDLYEAGTLDRYEVELIGANVDSIRRAEDREAFRSLMLAHGLDVLDGEVVSDVSQLRPGMAPAVVRPAFTLGGAGGGHADDDAELRQMVATGIAASPIGQVLVEKSIKGWSEYELEVMVDGTGTCIVVCSIENIDPVGVHTGDSWTVAPQQTLSDREYQKMRDAAFECVRAVGVATGGANVQFAYDHETGDMRIIEMNPRTSRSSALASKATGYPIAKLAALVAVGLTLEELPNDITQKTTAAFEPAVDYVAVKAPRFDFARYGVGDPQLTTRMQSVGETLGLGRTFPEALLKAHAGLEDGSPLPDFSDAHPYFRAQLEAVSEMESSLGTDVSIGVAKRFGLPASRIAELRSMSVDEVRRAEPVATPLAVDSCAAEFEAGTPYFYLSHERDARPARPTANRPVMIIGSGPNRIGQGIEFDYSCVHAALAFQRMGHPVVMVNSNPETVSTDYDTSDRLYIEPLTEETVLDVLDIEDPIGVVVGLGGQTPIRLAGAISETGVPMLGLSLESIELCEERDRFADLMAALDVATPEWGHASNAGTARSVADRIGYPVLIRPDYVIGGEGMAVARGPEDIQVTGPSLVDKFLEDSVELDVEILTDGSGAWVAGVLEHVEEVGIHSGDSACLFPGPSVTDAVAAEIDRIAGAIGGAIGVRGLVNLQVALVDGEVLVLEVNPRASRTLPFLAKATGMPLVAWACRLMLGTGLDELALPETTAPSGFFAKEPVFPADRFPTALDTGPEMKSIGEVMAWGPTPAAAYQRALRAAGRSRLAGDTAPTLQSRGSGLELRRTA